MWPLRSDNILSTEMGISNETQERKHETLTLTDSLKGIGGNYTGVSLPPTRLGFVTALRSHQSGT